MTKQATRRLGCRPSSHTAGVRSFKPSHAQYSPHPVTASSYYDDGDDDVDDYRRLLCKDRGRQFMSKQIIYELYLRPGSTRVCPDVEQKYGTEGNGTAQL